MTTLKARLLGLAATLGIIAVIVGVPVLLVAIQAVPSAESFSWNALLAPDDGTLALAVITVVAWLAWLVVAAAITVEAFARLRRHQCPPCPWVRRAPARRRSRRPRPGSPGTRCGRRWR